MSRRIVVPSRASPVVVLTLVGGVAACGELAAVAGAPDRSVASITLHVPDSLSVGDTVQIGADPLAANGKPAWGDTVVTWVSSNPAIVALDASSPPTPAPSGFSHLIGKGSGQATITAQVAKITASKLVTVVGPADIAAGDGRLGYALADQPAAAGPYAPVASYRFNSSGGAVTVTRDSTGNYSVRFAGLARRTGQRDNVQVTAYGAPAGTQCKLRNWYSDAGTDMLVPVHCHAPGLAGAAVDSRFTILLSGARPYDPAAPFAFAMRLPQTQNLALDTSLTAFNSVTGHIIFGRTGLGVYNFAFPGLGPAATPVALLATAVGSAAEHCKVGNYDLTNGVLQAACAGTDGLPVDARPSVMWFTRGRTGHRFGFASTQNLGSVTPSPDPLLSLNSAGGAITSRRVATGQYTVSFGGLGRPAGATEIVMVSALKETDHLCGLVSWGNTGVNDLSVSLSCYDATGAPVDARFEVLVVE